MKIFSVENFFVESDTSSYMFFGPLKGQFHSHLLINREMLSGKYCLPQTPETILIFQTIRKGMITKN